MARSISSLKNSAEAPFLTSTGGILASLGDQFGGLLDLQGYLGIASSMGLIGSETKALTEKFETLDIKISKQEKLTREDYMGVIDGLIELIEVSFINEDTKIETLRKAIMKRILEDQDLHHKITSAFSLVEVVSIILSTVIYSVNCSWIAPFSTIPMLAGPYLQYKASEPLHDYRESIPKNYQLQIDHFEREEKNERRNPALYFMYAVAFFVSVNIVPYSYIKERTPVSQTLEATSSRVGDVINGKVDLNRVIRGADFVALGFCLQSLAAYLFLFQIKRNQKTMTKRVEILLPYLEKVPDRNQDFFLQTLEALHTFKEVTRKIESEGRVDEKSFYRLIHTLNESLKKLEKEADPEIQKLFQQTTTLIEKIRKDLQSPRDIHAGTYPLLEYVRSKTRIIQPQCLPKKGKSHKDIPNNAVQYHGEEEIGTLRNEYSLEIIKQIDFPKRMKQDQLIQFLESMGGYRKERGGSHFSYEILYDGTIHSLVLSHRSEYYGTTIRNWIIKTRLSPEYVLEKWKEFNK